MMQSLQDGIPNFSGGANLQESDNLSTSPSLPGTTASTDTLLFIDAAVDNPEYFVDAAVDGTEVIILDPTQDGIMQISSVLTQYSGLSSVQIFSHGTSGALQLGDSSLDLATINTYRDELLGWAQSLTDDADVLLFGCNVAKGDAGQVFINQVSELTGADVAASDDLTGADELGGDWDLEATTGAIEAGWVVAPSHLESYSGVLNTLITANQADNSLSLYEADGLGGFSTPTNLSVAGIGPSTVITGDIDGDGTEDLITTDETSDSISLFINDGNGGFLTPQSFATANAPVEIDLADINNDGQLDAVVLANGANSFSVLLNNGTGGFSAAQTFAVGNTPVGIGVADVDSDGNLDILSASLSDEAVSVSFGDGTGNFGAAATSFGIGRRALDMATGDLNGDGFTDFVTVNASSRNASVGLGDGVGGFTVTNYGLGARANGVALGDVDGDGTLDIATSNYNNNTLGLLLNNGNGTFGGSSTFAVGSRPEDVLLADINGDGNLDALTSNTRDSELAILIGDGNGSFNAQPSLTTTVAPGGLAFGNVGGSGTPPPSDTTAPSLQTAAIDSTTLVLTYDEALNGASDPAIADYTINVNGVATTINAVDADGTTVTLTLGTAVLDTDVVTINYTPGATPVEDASGNDALALSGQAVTNDTAPLPPSDTTAPSLQTAAIDSTTLVLTYDEALNGASDPAIADYTINVNGVATTINAVDADGTTVTLTLGTAVLDIDVVTINYTPGATPVEDASGNDALALSGQAVTNDTAPLPPSDTTAPSLQTAAIDSTTLVLTYDEALNGASDPAIADYTINVNGVATTINAVDADGTTVTLTLGTAVLDTDVVTINYTPGATPVEDASGNDALALSGQAVTNDTAPLPPSDTTAPSLQTAAIDSTTLVLTYDEALNGASDPAIADYTVSVNGVATTINAVDADGTTVTLTLATAVVNTDIVTVDYTPGAVPIEDAAGNNALALSSQAVANDTADTTGGGPGGNGESLPALIVTNQADNSISIYATDELGGFDIPTTLPVAGTGPSTVITGDIDGDGLEDLLTTDETSNSVSLFINDGNGGFLTPQSFATASAPVEIDLADINNDGQLDAVVLANGANSFSVLLNNGTGGFSAAQTFAVGSTPVGIAVADVDSDGNLDVLSANLGDEAVSVSFGDGTGNFGAAATSFGIGRRVLDMATGDLNGDGFTDFVTVNASSRNVSVGLGDGVGGFTVTNYGLGARANGVALGDVDGDGTLDIATSNYNNNTLGLLLNNGNGTFGGSSTFAVGSRPEDVLLADINGDGNLDALTSNTRDSELAILIGDGNGSFNAQPSLTTTVAPGGLAFGNVGGTPIPDTTAPVLQTAVANQTTLVLTYDEALDIASDPAGSDFTVNTGGSAIGVSNVDADGTTVTLTLNAPVPFGASVTVDYTPGTNPIQDEAGNDAIALSAITVTNNSPEPDLTAPTLQSAVVDGGTLVLTYDEALNGASDPTGTDYVVTVNGSAVDVNTVDANGTTVTLALSTPIANGDTVTLDYTPGTTPVEDVAGNDVAVLTGQAVTNTTASNNTGGGSGLDSLIVTNRFDGSISVFESDGTGGFSAQTTFSTGGNQPFAVALGDIDRDGLNDVVVANRGSGSISLMINDGAGGFLTPQIFDVGNQPTHIVLEDVNADGILDAIVANNASDTVSILLGNASGSFEAQTTIATGDGPWEVAIADLNGDGNLDLTTVHFVGETVTVNLGDGQGNFAATSGTYATGSRPEGLVLEDVNNDNILDFVVSNASSRSVSVALGDGSGGFGTVINYATGASSSSPLALGDVNNDGFADIVVGNTADDNVSILLNNGDGTFGTASFFALGDSPFDIVVKDINGDGNLDIMSADANSNTVTVLAGDGTGSFSLLTTLAAGAAPVDMAFGSLSDDAGDGNPGGGSPGEPALVNAIVSGTTTNSTVKLIYSERLNGDADPSPSDYTVIVNGVAQTISSVDVLPGTDAKGTNVILSMASPILLGDVVTVSYTPGATAVQDLEGNAASGFANQSVSNLRDFTLTYDFMTTADTFDFTAFGYTYDYGYLNDFSTLPSEVSNTTGLDVRKNAADMTLEEIDAYINAILTLKDTTVLTDNGIEISLYDQFVAVHVATADAIGRQAPDGSTMVNPAHAGPAFMAWHRLLLTEYENALQAVNPNVTLPFWDWTDLDATLNFVLEDNFMGPDPDIGGDVTTGYFSLENGWGMRDDLSDGRWLGVDATPEALRRGSRVDNPGTWRTNVESTLNLDGFALFANNVERGTGSHNNAHGFMGGVMSNVSASPNDPVFWMLHANVDRLWAEWQIDDHWGTSFYSGDGQNYGHNLNDSLFLWDNGAIPIAEDLRDLLVRTPGSTTWVTNGTGSIAGDFNNTGTVSPGNSPGMLNIQGNYTQVASGELTVELAGNTPGEEFDVLKVDGTATLDGELNLYFLGDFAPTEGTFTFLEADSIEGDFSEVNIFGLETPISYVLYKSEDGTAYNLKMLGLDESGESGLGVAQTANALMEDTDLTMYNPRFGRGLDMYVYGYGDHHGWGLDGEDAIVDHSSHGGSSDWYLSYDVDINEWIKLLSDGAEIPEEYMSPMMHGDHGDHSGHDMGDHGDHSGHDMGDHDDHSGHDMGDHGDHSGHDMGDHGDHSGHDMSDHGDHNGHDMSDHGDHSGHDIGDHGDHSGHDMGDHSMDGEHDDHEDDHDESMYCQCEEGNHCGKPQAPESDEEEGDRPTSSLPQRIEGNLKHHDGILSFGDQYRRIKVEGNYNQGDESDLFMKVKGRRSNKKHDVLKVDGTARLDGTLNIIFDEDHAPKDGQVFKLIRANKIRGDFDAVNVFGLDSSYQIETEIRNGKRLVLTVTLPDGEESDSSTRIYSLPSDAIDRDNFIELDQSRVTTKDDDDGETQGVYFSADGGEDSEFQRQQHLDNETFTVQDVLDQNPLAMEWWLNSLYSRTANSNKS